MNTHPILLDLSKNLINNPDRYEAHENIKPILQNLCLDRDFLHEALTGYLNDPKSLKNAKNNTIPLLSSGDLFFGINLFCPIRDGGLNITSDNIHHHGWRLLSTGVISGEGYETINFVKNSHLNREGGYVNLEIDEIFRHTKGDIRFIDSNTAHVVFHNTSTSATLAIWSADHIITTQSIKRRLEAFPLLRKSITKTIHTFGLNELLGLNALKGLYYHPKGGKIVETKNYSKPYDGNLQEILRCWFKFFQQIEFNNPEFWLQRKKYAPIEAIELIEKLINNEPIKDIGIWGNLRRRFSKTQILQAIDNSVSGDNSY
jgi:hypothetical protein